MRMVGGGVEWGRWRGEFCSRSRLRWTHTHTASRFSRGRGRGKGEGVVQTDGLMFSSELAFKASSAPISSALITPCSSTRPRSLDTHLTPSATGYPLFLSILFQLAKHPISPTAAHGSSPLTPLSYSSIDSIS